MSEQPLAVLEPIAERWDRDHLQVRDDRTVRGIDSQHVERLDRRYVNPVTGVSNVSGNVPPQFEV